MITIDKISAVVRLWELILAIMVTMLTFGYLHHEFILVGIGAFTRHSAVVIAAVVGFIGTINALIWLLPLHPSFVHFPADIVLAIAWTRVSHQLGGWLDGQCGNPWRGSGFGLGCPRWNAMVVCSTLCVPAWYISALIGNLWWWRAKRRGQRILQLRRAETRND